MASLKTDCRKFAPNIFNKSKCQNCFRGKDVHSAEALESDRATRKMCLCGYLFVAPDWDFSLPANRNKRWQRRWFMLYDDGELAYSVDECPETVPQAVIDMNCVLEVTDAESVTGNQFSLAITLPEKVHFVKGTSKEETKKWFEVLSKFPRNTVCGKYKRNATFPGVKVTHIQKSENNFTDWVNRRETVQVTDYSKTNGYINSMNRNSSKRSDSLLFDPEDDVIPTKDIGLERNVKKSEEFCKEKINPSEEKSPSPYKTVNHERFEPYSSTPLKSPTRSENETNKKDNLRTANAFTRTAIRNALKERLLSKAADVSSSYLKQEYKEARKLHSQSDVTPMIPSLQKSHSDEWKKIEKEIESLNFSGKNYHNNPLYVLMSDVPSSKKYESFVKAEKPHSVKRQESFGKKGDLIRQFSTWINEDQIDNVFANRTIHKSSSVPNAAILSDEKKRLPVSSPYSRSLFNDNHAKDRLSKFGSPEKSVLDNLSLVRGDPDGCNLDSLPSCRALSPPDVANDVNSETLSLKKGWLVKQEQNKWNKHWFVLRNSALTYYSDPIAEDSGILDGVVDLRKVQNVSEVQSTSGFTFCILMKDNAKLFLSAVTSKMRSNWIRAIIQAAKLKGSGLSETPKRKTDIMSSTLQHSKDISGNVIQRNSSSSSADSDRSMLSKQSSKSSVDEDPLHIRHNSLALPPSPPVTRTAISKVKERAKTRSHSRTRSRFGSTEIQESDPSYLGDSDDGTTDHSSSSLSATPISLSKEKPISKEPTLKVVKEKISRSERRSSLKLSSTDSLSPRDKKKKVFEIKDKLEDSSWTIWLDISKFCKEVEAKLDDFEKHDSKELLQRSDKKGENEIHEEQKKEIGHLVSCLMKVERRLHKVHNELEKAKEDLLLNNKDGDLEQNICKSLVSFSSLKELASFTGSPSQNVLLAQQLSRAKEENKRLKQDLKSTQLTSDNLELNCISFKQEMKQKDELHQSQMDLMVARVDDLTTKLLNSEKNVRQLRQRVAKLEQRQERRRSSLKGKEALTLSKEYESKLSELEQKIDAVETALKSSEELVNVSVEKEPPEKDPPGKEMPSMIMRLHNLDKKVRDISEIVDNTSVVNADGQDDFFKPKIQLQVKLEENGSNQDNVEGWNCLSLSTSMTDLTNLDSSNDGTISLSFPDCLENMNYKITSIITWLKSTLQLMHAERNKISENNSMDVQDNSNRELRHLINAVEHASSAIDQTSIIPKGRNEITEKLLYKIVLLQEIASIIFKMSSFDKYKAAILFQHLTRVRRAVHDIELYISQKSNSISSSSSKASLCNIVANLLFYRVPFPAQSSESLDVNTFYTEVENDKKRASSIILVFKEKFIENFCTTILELSENSIEDRLCPNSIDRPLEMCSVGQKQFLSYINHIITQVSNSFVAHISKSINELYFICSDVQYSSKWVSYICKLLQQELIHLSSEIKTICLKQLGYDFYSGSKCGVLVEYMQCSIWELAQVISINSVADGMMVLIKDAMHRKKEESKCLILSENKVQSEEDTSSDFDSFHQSLLQRASSIMSNLSTHSYSDIPWNFCNSSETSMAHRSVSSLLCFKQKWKTAIENERLNYKAQIEQLNQKLNNLRDELKRREMEGCQACIELRQEVSYLQGELDESRTLAKLGTTCEKCSNLRSDIQKIMEQHERDTFMIQKLEEQEKKWKLDMELIIKNKDTTFNEEKQKFEKELRAAQNKLKTMEAQYKDDLHNLQALYEQKLTQPQNDIVKGKYSSEIDSLKSLCEKGLEAMEASHQRIVGDLEKRHQKELEELILEKEKVLEEEAHATAVALEAVRRAHKDELEKQIKAFKEDFMLKMNARFEAEAFRKGYETEMAKVKYEILSIAEKYSVKCLENIALQENLETITEKLNATNDKMSELRARNQELQAQLASDSVQKLEEIV